MQRRVLQKLRAAPFDPGVRSVAQPSVKFLNEPRLADPRLADDQHQLAITLPRPLPAPRHHGDLFLAADERREIALSRTPAPAARPYKLEQPYRLWAPFQVMAAAFLSDKKAGDLALHTRRYHDCAWFCQRLYARGNVGDVAINLAARVDDSRTGFKTDAGDKLRF